MEWNGMKRNAIKLEYRIRLAHADGDQQIEKLSETKYLRAKHKICI